MAENMVKNVFLALMGAIVAIILYLIMFGWGNDANRFLSNKDTNKTNINKEAGAQVDSSKFEGVIFLAAHNIEGSIARYYYEYCYLPNAHVNDGYDMALGYISAKDISYQTTPSDLSARETTIVVNDKTRGTKGAITLNSSTNNGGTPSYSVASSSKGCSTGWYGEGECKGTDNLYRSKLN